MPKINTSSIGMRAEYLAKKFLEHKNYKILESNFFNKFGRRLGEIDIIAQKNNELIFIEVKSRILKNNNLTIIPEENITYTKLHKLNKIASFYISKNNLWHKAYHFDSISVELNSSMECINLKHLKDIFL